MDLSASDGEEEESKSSESDSGGSIDLADCTPDEDVAYALKD